MRKQSARTERNEQFDGKIRDNDRDGGAGLLREDILVRELCCVVVVCEEVQQHDQICDQCGLVSERPSLCRILLLFFSFLYLDPNQKGASDIHARRWLPHRPLQLRSTVILTTMAPQ